MSRCSRDGSGRMPGTSGSSVTTMPARTCAPRSPRRASTCLGAGCATGRAGSPPCEWRRGRRTFLGWNGGGVTVRSPLELDDDLLDYVAGFDLVHSSVYSRSEPELPKLAGGRALVSFDLSSEDGSDRRLSGSHLSVGRSRAAVVLAPQRRRDAGPARRRGRTRGIRRARNPRHRRRDRHRRPGDDRRHAHLVADPASIVDTMGCGDAFLAGSSSRCSVRVGAARLRPIARDSPRRSLRGRMPRTRSASSRALSAAADLPANPSPLACGESGRADERSARRYGD